MSSKATPARRTAPASKKSTLRPKIVVKNSRIHGRGVYAARKLEKGERIIEYRGERITWKECDRRPPSDPDDPNHTFFFSLSDGKHVIDANVGGNAARWINHSCDPNCDAVATRPSGRRYGRQGRGFCSRSTGRRPASCGRSSRSICISVRSASITSSRIA